jgi:hypothetical protein
MFDFIKDFSFAEFTDGTIAWLGIFISGFIIFYGYRYQASKAPLKDQLYSVYLPMFRIIEPTLNKGDYYLTKRELDQICNTFESIIDKHYEFVEPSIIHWTKELRYKLAQKDVATYEASKTYRLLCEIIDNQFERTRKRMFLPTRGLIYRLNNREFTSRITTIYRFIGMRIRDLLVSLFIAASIGIFLFSITAFIRILTK